MALAKRVRERIAGQIKRFKPILASARDRDASVPPFKLVQRGGETETHGRDRISGRGKAGGDSPERTEEQDYLDIPAFLRRQAD